MNYDEAVDFIHSVLKFGSKLGLQNITELMNRLGNPQNKIKTVHVAGTNGKGSTSAMIANILKKQGYRTGLFTSPYIEDFCERIQINGENIPHDILAELTGIVQKQCAFMVADGFNHPTEFEIVTAIGFLYFKDCDYAVIEVGLGGRLDATNVLEKPILTVITLIDYDHTEYLGSTLSEIAYEKCGIIKPHVPVVSYGYQDNEALDVIKKISASKNSPLIIAPHISEYNGVTVYPSLKGPHQIKNMQTVLSAVRALKEQGVKIDDQSVLEGISSTKFMGRFEYIDKNIVIDGAHNISGMASFCDTVRECRNNRLIVVCGMLADKDYHACAMMLKDVADILIATTPDSPRNLSAEKFAAELGTNLFFEDPYEAVDYAKSVATDDDLICVCGSLYLIGGIRRKYRVM